MTNVYAYSFSAFEYCFSILFSTRKKFAYFSVNGSFVTEIFRGEFFYGRRNLVRLYFIARQFSVNVEGADINKELTADLVGDYLFTDKDFINHLTGNRNLFQKVYDEIKYLCKVATGKELTEIEKVKKEFEKAWKTLSAGEIEAFDTMNRMELSAEERKATRPNIDNPNAIVLGVAKNGDSATRLSKNEALADTTSEVFDNSIAPLSENLNTKFSILFDSNEKNKNHIDKDDNIGYNGLDLYTTTDEFYLDVAKGDRDDFPRSLANKTTGMAKDEIRIVEIIGAGKVYFFEATGYMKGQMLYSANIKDVDEYRAEKKEFYNGYNSGRQTFSSWSSVLPLDGTGTRSDIHSIENGRTESDVYEVYGESRTRNGTGTQERIGQNIEIDLKEVESIVAELRKMYGFTENHQTNYIAPIKEVSSTDDAFFDTKNPQYSLSWEGDNRTLGGSYRFSGKDLLKSEQDIAPVAVGVAENATTNKTVDDIAPVNGNNADIVKSKTLSYSEEVKAVNSNDNTAPAVETKPRIRQADNKNTAPDGMGERSWYGTSTGSEAVDGIVALDDIPDDVRYYQVKSNKKSLETANARLTRDGFEKSKEYFEGRMSDRKLTVEDIALVADKTLRESSKIICL